MLHAINWLSVNIFVTYSTTCMANNVQQLYSLVPLMKSGHYHPILGSAKYFVLESHVVECSMESFMHRNYRS